MTAPASFSALIELPDGRRITVTIDVPEDHPTAREHREFVEHAEVAQMGAAHVLGVMRRSDMYRARRLAEAQEVPF